MSLLTNLLVAFFSGFLIYGVLNEAPFEAYLSVPHGPALFAVLGGVFLGFGVAPWLTTLVASLQALVVVGFVMLAIIGLGFGAHLLFVRWEHRL